MHTLGRVRGKFESQGFFKGPKSLRASSRPGSLHTIQMVTCPRWPHTFSTPLQKQLRNSPSIKGVERGFVQGGHCLFYVIAHYPTGKYHWISGTHHGQTCSGIWMCSSGTVAPPFPYLDQVTPSWWHPQGEPWNPREGAHQRDQNWVLPLYLHPEGLGSQGPSAERPTVQSLLFSHDISLEMFPAQIWKAKLFTLKAREWQGCEHSNLHFWPCFDPLGAHLKQHCPK